jgi:hypothetical protein
MLSTSRTTNDDPCNLNFYTTQSQYSIVCSFKYILKVGVEESIVNVPRITDHGPAV